MSITFPITPLRVQSLSQTADDTGVALKIKCLGDPATYADPRIGIASHTLTFYSNYTTGTVAETYVFQTGVTAGTISLADGADNMTFAELLRTINKSQMWNASLVCALPEDIVYKHSGTLDAVLGITVASDANGQACATEAGTLIYFDTSADTGNGLHYDICFGPEVLDGNWASFMGRKSAPADPIPDSEDWRDANGVLITGLSTRSKVATAGFVATITAVSTYASGTSTVTLYEANDTASVALDSWASGATTVSLTKSYTNEMRTLPGKRLVVRLANSAALSSASLSAQGGFGTV